MGCGINSSTRPKIITKNSLYCNKITPTITPLTHKKNYKTIISQKSWLNILDFLSYNEIKEIGKTNKLFNCLVKQNTILIKFFKNKNTYTPYQNLSRNTTYEVTNSKPKVNIKCYESFALLQMNQIYEAIDSNYSTPSIV